MGGEADVGCACDTSKKEYRYLDMETKADPTKVESPRKFIRTWCKNIVLHPNGQN